MPSDFPTRQQLDQQAEMLRRIANAGYAGIPTPAGANPNYGMIQNNQVALPPAMSPLTQMPNQPPMPAGLQAQQNLRNLSPQGMYQSRKTPSAIPLEAVLNKGDNEINVFAEPLSVSNKIRGMTVGAEFPFAEGNLSAEANTSRMYGVNKEKPDSNYMLKYKRGFASGGFVDGESLVEPIGMNTQAQINSLMGHGGFANFAEGGPVSPLNAAKPSAIDTIKAEFQKRGLDFDKFISQPAIVQEAVKHAADMGTDGDTILAHINPREAQLLKQHGGSGAINPHTGLPMFGDGEGGAGDRGEGGSGSANDGGGSSGGQGGQSESGQGGQGGGQGESGQGGQGAGDTTGGSPAGDASGGFGGGIGGPGVSGSPETSTIGDVAGSFSNTPDSVAGFGVQDPAASTVNDVTSSFSMSPDRTPGFGLANSMVEAPAAVAFGPEEQQAIAESKALAATVDRNPSLDFSAQQAKAEMELNEALELMNREEMSKQAAFSALTSNPMSTATPSATPSATPATATPEQVAAATAALAAALNEVAPTTATPSATPAATTTTGTSKASSTTGSGKSSASPTMDSSTTKAADKSFSVVDSINSAINNAINNPAATAINAALGLASPALGLANMASGLAGFGTLGSGVQNALGIGSTSPAGTSSAKGGQEPNAGAGLAGTSGGGNDAASVLNSLASNPQTIASQPTTSNPKTTPTTSRTFAGYSPNPLTYGYGPAQNYYTYAAKGGRISPLNAKRKAK